MKTWMKAGLVALAVMAPASMQAQNLSEDDVKRLALEAIRENPEIIAEAIQILRKQQADAEQQARAQVLQNQKQLLEHDPNAPELGNPDGDVTIVEFFDYNCPYCKRVAPEVAEVLKSDPNVRVVYREWPVLSEGSVYATRAALAARKQGKYFELHEALMGMKGHVEEASVLRAAQDLGLDMEQLKADMQAPEVEEHIKTTRALASQLGFQGTPSFVIGDAVAPGFIDLNTLQKMVADARKAKN